MAINECAPAGAAAVMAILGLTWAGLRRRWPSAPSAVRIARVMAINQVDRLGINEGER